MRCGHPLPGACGRHNHNAGLAPILRRRCAGYDFHRLNGIDGKLVGEHFALLVGNRLAVDGERILRVIADPVEEAIGIGSDSRRGESNQRTQRRRRAFQGKPVEQLLVDVGVEGRIVLHQIARRTRP